MLVLTRKIGESIVIHDNIEITVIEIIGDTARIGIKAPRTVPVYRKELFEAIQESNRSAAVTQVILDVDDQLKVSKRVRKKKTDDENVTKV